jgi:hypothetical protein
MIMKGLAVLLLASATDAFFVPSNLRSTTILNAGASTHSPVSKQAFDGSSSDDAAPFDPTTLGNLQIPSVGIGTISWSSDSRKYY